MSGKVIGLLRNDEPALGLGMSYPAPSMIENFGIGWDWIWIDGQHGQIDYRTILHAVQVCEMLSLSAIVRVPGHNADLISLVADTGAEGVIVPMVNSAEEARRIVGAACFPPTGERSYGGRRIADREGPDYHRLGVERFMVICQVETPEAAIVAEEIAAVDGVSALLFGPDDMRLRLGLPMTTSMVESDSLTRAMQTTAAAARNQGKYAASVAADAGTLSLMLESGYRMLACGSDAGFLREGSSSRLEESCGILEQHGHRRRI